MMKRCKMYLRKGTIYIRTSSRARQGIWKDEGPVGQIADLGDFALIGSTALRFAEQSRENRMIDPMNLNGEWTWEWLDATGVSSWRTFIRSAISITMGIYDETVVTPYVRMERGYNITPYYRKGLGYLGLDHIHLPLDATHEEIGRAIMEAFDRCT